MVGLGRLERPTSPLSGVRSNHLSYRPASSGWSRGHASDRSPRRGPKPPIGTLITRLSGEERETKTAASRIWGLTGPVCFEGFRYDRPGWLSREGTSLERR